MEAIHWEPFELGQEEYEALARDFMAGRGFEIDDLGVTEPDYSRWFTLLIQ